MGFRRRRPSATGKDDNVDNNGTSSLCVFGYASRLYAHNEVETSEGDLDNKHLIPWNGDEGLLVDRYDCRLYLHSLGEFGLHNVQSPPCSGDLKTEPTFDAERLEEEMCDEERWRDMDERVEGAGEDNTPRDGIESTQQQQNRRGAEIAFNYGKNDRFREEESSSSEEEIEVPYLIPDTLKLPTGIDLPRTMKESAVIERTAVFVVEKGPQMEVVIKAKQQRGNNPEQFAFLEFDHRLHPFYKYVCKLIREQKYTPAPVKSETRPKQKKLRRLEELRRKAEDEAKKAKQSGDSDDSDTDGYLHPLLTGAGPHKKEAFCSKRQISRESANAISGKAHKVPNMEDNIYASLMKNLNTLIAGPPTAEQAGNVSSMGSVNKPMQMSALERETDEARIADYNRWHFAFYGKESPYSPLPPPVVTPAPSDMPDMEPAVSVAARYVALNGAQAEERLIEHNGESCEFLLPKSRYYTYYQSRVRQHQEVMSQNYMEAISKMKGAPSIAPHKGIGWKVEPTPELAGKETAGEATQVSIKGELPALAGGTFDEDDNDEDQQLLKRERKERARLFAERLLNEKLALKRKQEETRRALDAESSQSAGSPKSAAGTSTPATVTAGTISSIIDEKITHVLKPSAQAPRDPSPHRRSPQRPRRNERRRRSPSPRHRRESHRRDESRSRSRRSHSRKDTKRRHGERPTGRRSRSPSASSSSSSSSYRGKKKFEKRSRHKRKRSRRHSNSSSGSRSRQSSRR